MPVRKKLRDEARAVTKVVAKGKKRQTMIVEDEQALAEFEKAAYRPRSASSPVPERKADVKISDVVQTWAAEIQEVYSDLGTTMDDANSTDKALTLWRMLHLNDGVTVRAKSLPVLHC